ncbi:MAG: HAD hydrolase-like protein [Pseudomonadota bacterium]
MSAHIYFDLDGTLTDPYEGITKCILYAIDKLGFERPSDDWLYKSIGPPLWDTFPEVVGDDLTIRAVELYRERFNDVGWLENKPYDGILDALTAVHDTGARLFVATAKPQKAAARIIEHFGMGQFFTEVYGSEPDGTRSRKGDLLEWAIGRNEPVEHRVMIGDRKHDLIGAVANGMHPVGVSYGYGSVAELERAGARSIAASPAEIPALLL